MLCLIMELLGEIMELLGEMMELLGGLCIGESSRGGRVGQILGHSLTYPWVHLLSLYFLVDYR